MRQLWTSIALCLGLLATVAAEAQQAKPAPAPQARPIHAGSPIPNAPLLQRPAWVGRVEHQLWDCVVSNGVLQARLEHGRVTVMQHGKLPDIVQRPDEGYSIQSENGVRTDRYEQTTDDEATFLVECVSDGRLTMRRNSTATPAEPAVEYLQIPDGPVSLSMEFAGVRKVYQAPSLWHLALAHPEECRQHLLPLLAAFFPCCKLLGETAWVQNELLAEAEVCDILSRQRLRELISQLGDNHFAKREAADRQLRARRMGNVAPVACRPPGTRCRAAVSHPPHSRSVLCRSCRL